MRSALALASLALVLGCPGRADTGAPTREPNASGPAEVAWSDVRAELAAHVCLRTFELPTGPIEEPMYGPAISCELPPPETALERAVERAWKEAMPVLSSLRHETRDALLDILATTTGDERLDAVRRTYLKGRFRGLLLAHLEPALADEGLACIDCPSPYVPTPRTIAWAELTPYLIGYVWPESVETPRDADGRPTGERPQYVLKVCIGADGIDEIEDPDPALLELGFLATLQNDVLVDRAAEIYRGMLEEPEFAALHDDFLRSRWLRQQLGPRLLAEPAIRTATCATVERFAADTGLTIAECREWLGR